MTYDNTNRGTIGKNKRKEQDTHPDLSGKINVEGKDYWLSGWKKTGPEGDTFYSLSVKPKDNPANTPNPAPKDNRAVPPDDDDIPFSPINRRAYF